MTGASPSARACAMTIANACSTAAESRSGCRDLFGHDMVKCRRQVTILRYAAVAGDGRAWSFHQGKSIALINGFDLDHCSALPALRCRGDTVAGAVFTAATPAQSARIGFAAGAAHRDGRFP